MTFMIAIGSGCNASTNQSLPINLPTNEQIESVNIELVPGTVIVSRGFDSEPTTQPIALAITDDLRIAKLLTPLRKGLSTIAHKCAHVASLEIVLADGKRERWLLRPGHGDDTYDISGPGGWFAVDAKPLDSALRAVGATEVAAALLPPRIP